MSINLVLIDAMNLIRRIYAVQERPFKSLTSISDETAAQLIHNTAIECENALKKILTEHLPTHALAVFDAPNPGWRQQLFSGYKQGRSKMPDILESGLDSIQQRFMNNGVDSLLPDADEADDLIATLASKVADNNGNTIIVSTDKGYCQLLSPHIRIWDHFKRQWISGYQVQEKFGVVPGQLTEYWALAGDTTNKIPGIEGIGAKTAATILQKYHSVELAIQASDLNKNIAKKLIEQRDDFVLYSQLTRLKTDISLSFNLQDIRFPSTFE